CSTEIDVLAATHRGRPLGHALCLRCLAACGSARERLTETGRSIWQPEGGCCPPVRELVRRCCCSAAATEAQPIVPPAVCDAQTSPWETWRPRSRFLYRDRTLGSYSTARKSISTV